MLSILNRIRPMARILEDYKSSTQNITLVCIPRQESCKSMKGIDRQTLLEANVSENPGYSTK